MNSAKIHKNMYNFCQLCIYANLLSWSQHRFFTSFLLVIILIFLRYADEKIITRHKEYKFQVQKRKSKGSERLTICFSVQFFVSREDNRLKTVRDRRKIHKNIKKHGIQQYQNCKPSLHSQHPNLPHQPINPKQSKLQSNHRRNEKMLVPRLFLVQRRVFSKKISMHLLCHGLSNWNHDKFNDII